MSIRLTNTQRCLPSYPKVGCRFPQWKRLIDELIQRRFTSGEVDQCTGLSRKVLMDWDHLGLLEGLYRGLGVRTGDERHGRWRMFSVFDIWTLAFLKRLRDEGIYIERLRHLKDDPKGSMGLNDKVVPLLYYEALPHWVYREDFWLHGDRREYVSYGPAWHVSGNLYNAGLSYQLTDERDLFLSANLSTRMDTILRLPRSDLEMVDHHDHLVFSVNGQRIMLESLPETDEDDD